MKIILNDTPLNPFGQIPQSFIVKNTRIAKFANVIDAENPLVKNGKNSALKIEFSICTNFESESSAQCFGVKHCIFLSKIGSATLKMEFADECESPLFSAEFSGAALSGYDFEISGVQTKFKYNFIAQKMEQKNG